MSRSVLPGPSPTRLEVHERTTVDDALWRTYAARAEGFARDRLEGRFEHGLRYFELRGEGEGPVASTWIVPGGERYLDEIALSLALPSRGLWVRDVWVRPDQRGRRRFGELLDRILGSFFPESRSLWSDLDPDNRASLKAHLHYGFEPRASGCATRIGGRWMVRRFDGEPGTRSYLPQRRVIAMDADFQRHQERHTA